MSDHFTRITFRGGNADGREMHVPALQLADVLWVKALSGGLSLYTGPRPGTEEYRRAETDEYVVVDA